MTEKNKYPLIKIEVSEDDKAKSIENFSNFILDQAPEKRDIQTNIQY